jgi:pilus assembly protein Flp/PilA
MRIWTRLLNNQRGATAIEYALVASMISVAGIVAFENLGNSVDNRYTAVEQTLDSTL